MSFGQRQGKCSGTWNYMWNSITMQASEDWSGVQSKNSGLMLGSKSLFQTSVRFRWDCSTLFEWRNPFEPCQALWSLKFVAGRHTFSEWYVSEKEKWRRIKLIGHLTGWTKKRVELDCRDSVPKKRGTRGSNKQLRRAFRIYKWLRV